VSHEFLEHVEHAGHAGGGHGHGNDGGSVLPQLIGITVAILGVLMALCSAQVGAARTELIATMVEENSAKARFLSVSNKYRMLQAQLQQLHAAMPDPEVMAKKHGELKKLEAETKAPDVLQAMKASKLQTEMILNTVTPTPSDVERFLNLIDRIREEMDAAGEWSQSYKDAIKLHASTAERFEIAQLAAEIGIVIASVGLLLSRKAMFARGLWIISMSLGLVAFGVGGVTQMANTQALHAAEEKIHHSEHHYKSFDKDKEDLAEDKKLEADIRSELKKS
jgi:Domain of unknown function (DUF4337)